MDNSSAGDGHTGWQLTGQQGLPPDVLDAVLHQLDASSRLQIFRTSKFLATAVLERFPRIQLTYPAQHDIMGQHLRELAPFLTEALQDRKQPTLHLTLQPARSLADAIKRRHRSEPAAATLDAARLVSWTLGAVPLCEAVNCLAITWGLGPSDLDLPWEPVFSAALAASFPSLTSLTYLDYVRISPGSLVRAITHPLLLPRLRHLDIGECIILPGQLGRSPFIGSRLEELHLRGQVHGGELLSGLVPFPSTLIKLAFQGLGQQDWVGMAEAVSSLTQLQQLTLTHAFRDGDGVNGPGLTALLQALAHLPSLHTLVMYNIVVGQEQLDALLALTQITRLELQGISGLTISRASADCSWRQLEVRVLDWVTAAYLPLHSLTHPLQWYKLVKGIEEPTIELLAAAELNLCERNQAGLVLDGDLCLSKATVDLLTEQYLSHRSVASSSHSGPSTSLASSSSPDGHITPGGPGSSRGQGGSAAGGQALMQRLGRCVKVLRITMEGLDEARLSEANRDALPVLFPNADIVFGEQQRAWPGWPSLPPHTAL